MARTSGQIISKGDRKWQVRWFEGVEDGKRIYRSKTIHGTKRDAQRYLNGVHTSRDLGTYAAPSKKTLGEFLDDWLESRRSQLQPRTLESYAWLLDRYVRPWGVPPLSRRRLDTLRLEDIQALVNDLGTREVQRAKGEKLEGTGRTLSARTIRLTHAVLGAALKDAVRQRLIVTNPAELAKLPRQERREMRALTPDEVQRFREAAREDDFAPLWDFFLATGCRPGEALAVRWQDLDLERGRLQIVRALTRVKGKPEFKEPKTKGSRRSIPLGPSVVRTLARHRKAQAENALKLGRDYARDLDLVFANPLGTPLDQRNLARRHFEPILKRAELGTLRMYDLRHTHATQLLVDGVHAKVVSERLGHSSIRTTLDVYTHVIPGMQADATDRLERSIFADEADATAPLR